MIKWFLHLSCGFGVLWIIAKDIIYFGEVSFVTRLVTRNGRVTDFINHAIFAHELNISVEEWLNSVEFEPV